MTACLKCSQPLTTPPTGRRPVYCSTACRRSAENEVRRITRRLEKLEEAHDAIRSTIGAPHAPRDFYGRDPAQQLQDVASRIAEAEARLRALLSEGTTDANP